MKLKVLTQKYACQGCTVCCEVMAVMDLGKPFYRRCEHQQESSCAIYDQRPAGCREFICAWALGLLGESQSWRPDEAGLMFFLSRGADGLWLEIYESTPGAANDRQRCENSVRRIVSRVEKSEPIVGTRLHRFGDRIGLGFVSDPVKYPGAAPMDLKSNRYAWIDGDCRRQVFLECHDPGDERGQ